MDLDNNAVGIAIGQFVDGSTDYIAQVVYDIVIRQHQGVWYDMG